MSVLKNLVRIFTKNSQQIPELLDVNEEKVFKIINPEVQRLLTKAKEGNSEVICQKILEIDPECSDAYFILGNIYQGRKQIEEAEDCHRMAIYYQPEMADAYNNLGNLLRINGRFDEAYLLLKKAVELRPNFSDAYFNLGMTANALGKSDEALANYQTAIEFNSDADSAYNNMGLILLNSKGEVEKAEACFLKAIEINPNLYDVKVNLCLALQSKGDLKSAIKYYNKLLEGADDKQTRFHRAIAYLLNGNFREGWQEYHYRWTSKVALPQQFAYPEWNESQLLNNKTLLIYTEQGLGDEIMFSACLQDIIPKVKRCILDCDPRMVPIFKRSFPTIDVHGGKKKQPNLKWLEEFEPIDFQMPIGDLPKYFRNEWNEFPQHNGYLKADPGRIDFWKKRLAELGPGAKIGISWKGGLAETRKDLRSIPLSEWLPILRLPSIHFINLQYTNYELELTELKIKHGINIQHWDEAINDYSETGALVCALDLVISVCTSVVHLAGALGRPIWVLVPAIPEWRYLQQGEKMPWYPSVKLFRQPAVNQWGPLLERVRSELALK